MYGPWPSPPPCNTNSECVALLASQFPTQQGLGQFACFSALQSDQNFAGGCACNGMYGLGGPTCGEQTEATPGALALAIIPCVILALTVAWFLPTLVFVLSRVRGKNRVLKFNAVGVSYMATWLALVCLLISIVTHILLSLYSSPTVLTLHDVTHRIIIIVLGAAVLNLIAVIVELSITMKAISNIEKYRFRVIAFVLFTAISLTVTYLVTPPQVSAFIVLCFTSAFVFISYLAPAWVFIQITLVNRTSEQVANIQVDGEHRAKLTCWSVARALFVGGIDGGGAIMRLFGYSSSVNGASSSGGTKSKNNNNLNAQEDEKKNRTVIKFFSRAFKLGVAMACCLLVCAIGMGLIAFTLTQYTANRSFSLEALGTSLSEIGMVGAAYQLLWFLDESFTQKKHLQQQQLKTADSKVSKLVVDESKNIIMSRADDTVDEPFSAGA